MIKKAIYKLSPGDKRQNQGVSKQNDRAYRLEKSFKKRQKYTENHQSRSPQNGGKKIFKTYRQNPQSHLSPNKFNRTQSFQPNEFKEISKLSLKDALYKNKEISTPISKMKQIADILIKRVDEQPFNILYQLYKRNERFQQLLHQWQIQELYQETDKFIYRINQFYINVLEKIVQKAFFPLEKALQKYESTIKLLQSQNQQLKIYKFNSEYSQAIISDLKMKLKQQQQKNQWASIFLASFATLSFDAEAFLKQKFLAAQSQSIQGFDNLKIPKSSFHLKSAQNNKYMASKIIKSEYNLPSGSQKGVNPVKQHSLK